VLIFDQLKKNDPQLRPVTAGVLVGLAVLLAGLWWVQIVSARDYQENLELQSFRSVRIPAVRGKILDSQGTVLAENQPTYNISLYLDELRNQFQDEYLLERPKKSVTNSILARWFGSPLVKTQYVRLRKEQIESLKWQARYKVAGDVVAQIAHHLRLPLTLDVTNFHRHYQARLALPFPILTNATPTQIARFEEHCSSLPGVDLEVQSTRVYPRQTLASHVLGHLQRDDDSKEGEEAFFSYRLPDFRGVVGIEYAFDKDLRGLAGAKSVLVNNVGYRQTENIWSPAEPGQNVVLTLDAYIQDAAEKALETAPVKYAGPVRGAVVVMDVHSGDILAMASSPTLNPNIFVQGVSRDEWQRILNVQAEKNRATRERYMPGSVFKTVVGMAALENGLNPDEKIFVEENPAQPGKGYIKVSGRPVRDTAPAPGYYDFRRAIVLSCNAYFITVALRMPLDRILNLGHRLHLGERTDLPRLQETAGDFPDDPRRTHSVWNDRRTANLSIGQDPVWVTPLQVAVLTSAIANGGKVLWPRLISRIEPASPAPLEQPQVFPSGLVRDELGVSARTISILHDAMLAETEDREGTGHSAATNAPGLHICGKTGTAQVMDERNMKIGQTTWFASFAPYKSPRYAVVVMVEDGISGGTSCSPVAGKIYKAIIEREHLPTDTTVAKSE
jgi:penicillin-binding protein 2